jgi:hypothetical protein
MINSFTHSIPSFHGALESHPLKEGGANKNWYGDLKEPTDSPTALNTEHWISDSSFYLLVWAGTGATNAFANFGNNYDKEIVQSLFSGIAMLSVAIDFLGTQSGYANLNLSQQLKASLDDLIKCTQESNLSELQLEEKVSKCASNLRQLETVPGWCHFCGKVGTDVVANVVGMSRAFYGFVSTGHIRTTADDLLALANGKEFGTEIGLSRSSDALNKAAANIPPSEKETFAATLDEQHANFKQAAFAAKIFAGASIAGGIANVIRGIIEMRLTHKAMNNQNEKLEKIQAAKNQLNKTGANAAGTELLTQVEKISNNRKKSARAGFWTAPFRILSGAWGIAAAILTFCAVTIPTVVGAAISSFILLIYTAKCIVQANYNRRANRIETRIANYIKVLSQKGSAAYQAYLEGKLLRDFKLLAQGGKELWNFLKAMKLGHLYTQVENAFLNKKLSERFPILKRVLEICFSPSSSVVDEAIAKRGKAGENEATKRILAINNKTTTENADPVIQDSLMEMDDELLEGLSKVEFDEQEKRLFTKFMENLLEKAIYSIHGKLPGIRHPDPGTREQIANAAKESIRARVGRSNTTDRLFTILEGLHRNGKVAKDSKLDFVMGIVRGTTWRLADESKECMKALESQDIKQVSTTTRAAALHQGNIREIAQCIHGDNENDVQELTALLKGANLSEFRKVVAAIDRQDEKTLRSCQSSTQYNSMVKAALMLSGKTSSEAEGLLTSVTIAGAHQASDLISVLGIFNGKYSCANFSSKLAATQAHGFLLSKQIATTIRDSTLFDSGASNEDPGVHRYIEDIVCGKIALQNVPDWLLDSSLKQKLNGKVPKSCKEALGDELRIAMRFHLNGEIQNVRSLKWPAMEYYGKGTVANKHLSKSFGSILNIQTVGATAKEMLDAARVFANLTNNRCTDKQLVTLAKQGGLVGAVVLRCVTGQFDENVVLARKQAREQLKNVTTLDDLRNAFPAPKKKAPIEKENLSILSKAGDPDVDLLLKQRLLGSNLPFEELHKHVVKTRARLNSMQISPSHLIDELDKEGIEGAIGVRRPLANQISQPQPGEALEYDSSLERIVEGDLEEDWDEYGIKFKHIRLQPQSDGASEYDSPSEEIADGEIDEGVRVNITVRPRP